LVAFTTHEDPADDAVRVDPETEHAPEITPYDTVPVPDPPDVAKDKSTPKVPEVDVSSNSAWFARVTETVVFEDVASL
jgi:hypothetical protein